MSRMIVGKNCTTLGKSPAVLLTNPKYPRNVGAVIRAASCFGVEQVWYTGNRFKLDEEKRLPREERMKGYGKVTLIQNDYPYDQFKGVTPVAIELTPNAEPLTEFEHPENALYVFGPEDGSIPQVSMRHCHRFVAIPTFHCTNLAAAVYIVLYDRLQKRRAAGLEPLTPVPEMIADSEARGWENHKDFGDISEMG